MNIKKNLMFYCFLNDDDNTILVKLGKILKNYSKNLK